MGGVAIPDAEGALRLAVARRDADGGSAVVACEAGGADRLRKLLVIALAFLVLFDLLLELFDDFLTEVGSLGEFFFDFAVDGDISIESFDFLFHFIVPEQQLLRLFTLVFQFCRQLMVLDNSQPCCRLQLFVVEGQKVRFSLLDFEKHFFPELLGSPYLLSLHLAELELLFLLLLVELVFELSHFDVVLLFFFTVLNKLIILELQLPDLARKGLLFIAELLGQTFFDAFDFFFSFGDRLFHFLDFLL